MEIDTSCPVHVLRDDSDSVSSLKTRENHKRNFTPDFHFLNCCCFCRGYKLQHLRSREWETRRSYRTMFSLADPQSVFSRAVWKLRAGECSGAPVPPMLLDAARRTCNQNPGLLPGTELFRGLNVLRGITAREQAWRKTGESFMVSKHRERPRERPRQRELPG